MSERSGCLSGLLRLLLLNWLFDFLQERFGFGRGCSGCGCGVLLLIIFGIAACAILGGTDWLRIGF